MSVSVLRWALLVVGLSAAVAAAAPPTFQELEESLTCQCGCGLTVHSCNHLQCGSAIPLRREIRAQMALGKSREEIIAHFAGKYGEKILSSPTTTGFNLTAWVMPFLAVGLGGVLVALVARRWSKGARTSEPAAATPAAPVEHQRILERELKEFSE